MQGPSTDMYTTSYSLWRQALSGDPEGALRTLEQMQGEEMPLLTADLLARLYVRAGRLGEARKIWEMILQMDPGYAPAVQAMKKLNSSWLIRAVAWRYSLWFGLGGLLLFALYGLGTLFLGRDDPSFAVMGMAVIVAMLGIYLAGLIAWMYLTAVSVFGLGGGVPGLRVTPGQAARSRPGYSYADLPRY